MKLHEIWRYPIKSLGGTKSERTVLNPGQGLPHDRRWGLALPGGDASSGGGWQSKKHFVVLARDYALAALSCRFDDMSANFSLEGPGGLHADGSLLNPAGRAAIANGVAKHLGLAEEQTPTLVEAKEIGYFDTTEGPVSILNMASLRALEEVVGQAMDPQRFRMNFWIDGAEAWAENHWVGKRLQIGKAVLRITEPTGRCKATHVNPQTGEVDLKVMHALKEHFGHTQMGVYAKVESGGPVMTGDTVSVLD
ncbi:MAG TPA: MOSC domain-containing protein [Magnetovibrio sp.]